MKVMEIMQKKHEYTLDFSMSTDCQWRLLVNNLACFCCDEMEQLKKEGFYCSVYSNIGHTEDGFGFQVSIF